MVGGDMGLICVGRGAACATELIGGPVGITTPGVVHQELVVSAITVLKRGAITAPQVQ